VSAQTAGSGTLITIENLAKEEAANSKKIADLNRRHMDSYILEEAKSKRLQNELAELELKKNELAANLASKIESKLHEIENSTTWKNRKKSAQSGWKEYNPGTCSAGGPPPICEVDHWYRVSVTEAIREYDALVNKELDKIRNEASKYDAHLNAKRSDLIDFQDGDNEFTQLRDKINGEMNDMVAKNTDIRQRIAELSKIYVNHIENELKAIQNFNITGVTDVIAQKHYTQLKIGVLEVKLIEVDQETKKAIAALNEKMQQANTQKIEAINRELSTLKTSSETEISALRNEIWNLQVNLSTEINNAIEQLKQAFGSKKEIINEALLGRQTKLSSLENDIKSQRSDFLNKANDYAKKVEQEKIRLMNACSESGASCWGRDVVSAIFSNANKLISCTHNIENNNVLYSGCEEATASYSKYYNSLLNGISDEDLGKLKQSNLTSTYQKLLEKIN
jgi:DNA repair exonuclease SbcCD ATPase subunit